MFNKMSKIIDGIYIGSWASATNESHLESEGITHIVSAHEMFSNPFKNHKQKRIYLTIKIDDIPSANIYRHFRESNDFIHDARLNGGRVLIHCQMGISRSVTLAVVYMMTIANMSFNDVLSAVQKARPFVCPNDGFQAQTRQFEANDLSMERERLTKMYGSFDEIENKDKGQLKELMAK